jgi:hypothetical protein
MPIKSLFVPVKNLLGNVGIGLIYLFAAIDAAASFISRYKLVIDTLISLTTTVFLTVQAERNYAGATCTDMPSAVNRYTCNIVVSPVTSEVMLVLSVVVPLGFALRWWIGSLAMDSYVYSEELNVRLDRAELLIEKALTVLSWLLAAYLLPLLLSYGTEFANWIGTSLIDKLDIDLEPFARWFFKDVLGFEPLFTG